jgi:hypothetical protein
MSYKREDYYYECLASSFDEHSIDATPAQLLAVSKDIALAVENVGLAFHQPESPYPREIKRLTEELAKEREKVICRTCNGTGRIVSHGPIHSSETQCHKCHGAGRI